MSREAGDDQRNAGQVAGGGYLAEDNRPGEGGDRGEQGEHERERRPRHAGHRELVADVGDHRRADPYPGSPGQPGRVGEGGQRRAGPGRSGQDGGDQHRGAELVDPAHGRLSLLPALGTSRRIVGDLVTEHDVGDEARAVAESEHEAERLRREPDHGQRRHAGDGQREGHGVAAGAGAGYGQGDGAEELDRADGGQRQPRHGQVEQRVHNGQYAAKRGQPDPLAGVQIADQPPGPPPGGEHGRGAGDPQPHHTERRDVGEQEHGQRRAQIVEDRGHGEKGNGREPARHGAQPLARWSEGCRGGHRCIVAATVPTMNG